MSADVNHSVRGAPETNARRKERGASAARSAPAKLMPMISLSLALSERQVAFFLILL